MALSTEPPPDGLNTAARESVECLNVCTLISYDDAWGEVESDVLPLPLELRPSDPAQGSPEVGSWKSEEVDLGAY